MTVSIAITPVVNGVSITESSTTVTSSTLALAVPLASASVVTPYGTITATNVQEALQQLADQDFRATSTPTGANVSEGDTWYDTSDNIYKVYREISAGVFGWTNIVVTNTSDVLDAGAF